MHSTPHCYNKHSWALLALNDETSFEPRLEPSSFEGSPKKKFKKLEIVRGSERYGESAQVLAVSSTPVQR